MSKRRTPKLADLPVEHRRLARNIAATYLPRSKADWRYFTAAAIDVIIRDPAEAERWLASRMGW